MKKGEKKERKRRRGRKQRKKITGKRKEKEQRIKELSEYCKMKVKLEYTIRKKNIGTKERE